MIWNIPSQGKSAIVKVSQGIKVIVNILDTNNCATTVSSIIKVKSCNTPAKCIEIPIAFTPNKDGTNDKLRPLVNGCRIETINFQVFNRYGQLVFETLKTGEGWDGLYQGLAQPGGVYTYFCDYTAEGVRLQKKGAFILIR